jgi:hypothetical protein
MLGSRKPVAILWTIPLGLLLSSCASRDNLSLWRFPWSAGLGLADSLDRLP